MYFFVSQNYNYLFLYCSFFKNFSVFKKINYKVVILKYFLLKTIFILKFYYKFICILNFKKVLFGP